MTEFHQAFFLKIGAGQAYHGLFKLFKLGNQLFPIEINTFCTSVHKSYVNIERDTVNSNLHKEHTGTGVFIPQEFYSERRTV